MKLEEFISYEQPTNYIVHSDQYTEDGRTPVLTAGQSFVLGYTDEEDGIYNGEPVVIFDDFTTSVQYVDFPFKVKSSAMKILKNKANANIKFCYYLLSWFQEMPPNHKRQWISTTSQIDINLPSLTEQEAIVKKIEAVSNIIKHRNEELSELDNLIKARFVELFGDRYINDKNWNIVKLGDSISFNNGKAHEQVVDKNGEYVLVTSRAIASDFEDVRRTNALLFPLHKNDIVMVMSDVPNGKALAKCQLIEVDDKYTLNQRICSFDNYEYNPIFLLYLLNRHPYFLSFNDGNGQTNLRKNDILECELIMPPMDIQEQFADFVEQVDKSKVVVKKALDMAQLLFDSLMQEYFG